MHRVIALYGSSVGKKLWMAVTGVFLFGFTLLHMLGNLKAFHGREAFDAYAEFIREVGYPLLPHYGLLWTLRLALLAAVTVHVVAATQLWRQSKGARTHGYTKLQPQTFSYASRTMRFGGVIVLAFVGYHLLHMTTGTVHPDFVAGSAYNNLVIGFQSYPVAAFYLIAVGALCVHLYHGIWSAFATAGIENPRIERVRRPIAAVLAWGLFLGYALVPLSVLAGVVNLEG
ncbi:MAG: succinate dehydrogenase cytochrome b subunit [Gemmatimonadota bacterium]